MRLSKFFSCIKVLSYVVFIFVTLDIVVLENMITPIKYSQSNAVIMGGISPKGFLAL